MGKLLEALNLFEITCFSTDFIVVCGGHEFGMDLKGSVHMYEEATAWKVETSEGVSLNSKKLTWSLQNETKGRWQENILLFLLLFFIAFF